jgi:hypothetical protein
MISISEGSDSSRHGKEGYTSSCIPIARDDPFHVGGAQNDNLTKLHEPPCCTNNINCLGISHFFYFSRIFFAVRDRVHLDKIALRVKGELNRLAGTVYFACGAKTFLPFY